MNRSLNSFLLLTALVLGVVLAVPADTIKLKDGTVLTGVIISEDDKQMTMTVEVAGGTISKKEMVSRDDVLEVTRFTPAQLAERAMEAAYQNTRRYALSADRSFDKAYYDQVIKGVFLPFLAKFPNSTHTIEITQKITAWETERSRVALGAHKTAGTWVEPKPTIVQTVTPPARTRAAYSNDTRIITTSDTKIDREYDSDKFFGAMSNWLNDYWQYFLIGVALICFVFWRKIIS